MSSDTQTKFQVAREKYEKIRQQCSTLYKQSDAALKEATSLLFQLLKENGALSRYTWTISSSSNSYYLNAEERMNQEPELCRLLNVDNMGHYGGFKIWEGEVVQPESKYVRVIMPHAELRFDDGYVSITMSDMSNAEMKAVIEDWGIKIDDKGLLERQAQKEQELSEIKQLIEIIRELNEKPVA